VKNVIVPFWSKKYKIIKNILFARHVSLRFVSTVSEVCIRANASFPKINNYLKGVNNVDFVILL
jgi:hypothetical protein